MSKVLVDPAALEEAAKWLEVHSSNSGSAEAFAADALREAIAQPAEAEGPERWRELKQLAEKAADGDFSAPEPWDQDRRYSDAEVAWLEFAGKATPAVVLELIAALSAVTAERDRLESMLIQTTARHFAQEWKDHADDKKLDECLSEGIAMLEAERDQLRAEVERLRDAAGKAIAWLDAEQNESGVGINRRIKLCRDAENSLRAAMAAKEA